MKQERWLRIIPVALIMYTISYVDRANIALALQPGSSSSMVRDLFMDNEMRGKALGIFFWGYVLLQIPGGHLASRWSAKKFISICLILWGICAAGCGLTKTFRQLEAMRFLLGIAESGVLPATTVLLANWFPTAERARANGYWNLCQPLALVASGLLTGKLLGFFSWKTTLILEGILPFLWLPVWWIFISDHPREAKWISPEERQFLESTLKKEVAELEPTAGITVWQCFLRWEILVMIVIYFLHNCQAYGCMTFFQDGLKSKQFTPAEYGVLFAVPYAVTAVIMVLISRSSDKMQERRGHVAFIYIVSGVSLIASVLLQKYFWISYGFMCLAIPGPFAAIAPFWSIPSETLPRNMLGLVIGLVNGIGNLGGYFGPAITGWLKDESGGSINLPFAALAVGMLVAAGLCFLLPRASRRVEIVEVAVPNTSVNQS